VHIGVGRQIDVRRAPRAHPDGRHRTACLPQRPYSDRVASVVRREIHLHGQEVRFLEAGAKTGGPVLVLLHGLASSSATWLPVLPLLGRHVQVIAPDLLGHGQSAKPRSGDYSLGAYASGLRDLLVALGLDRATVVGHSFGGGVAMQFAYQFPELTQRLVLVASGGLGREVAFALRAATLPGTAVVLQVLAAITPRWLWRLARRAVRAGPVAAGADLDELMAAMASFADRGARGAFVQTTRSALNWSGQRLDGTQRLYLLAEVPVLLVGGRRDTVIPVEHTVQAHARLPGSRLEIFATGHFPHVEHPQRLTRLLLDFLATTTPARTDLESLRRQLRRTEDRFFEPTLRRHSGEPPRGEPDS
jgi:pimeloyl-ACP methyl ester carboxylesterase